LADVTLVLFTNSVMIISNHLSYEEENPRGDFRLGKQKSVGSILTQACAYTLNKFYLCHPS
jgi:hypothetical protein